MSPNVGAISIIAPSIPIRGYFIAYVWGFDSAEAPDFED
jgi:hypothetical protein